MRMIVALALAVAACGGVASQAEDQSVIRADGRAIDGDTVSFDVRLLGADAFEKSNCAAPPMAAGRAARRRRTMHQSC